MTEPTEMKKHPLAIAWDEWLASPEGIGCARFDNLTRGVYLTNRLEAAFNAGAGAGERTTTDHVITTIKQLGERFQLPNDLVDALVEGVKGESL